MENNILDLTGLEPLIDYIKNPSNPSPSFEQMVDLVNEGKVKENPINPIVDQHARTTGKFVINKIFFSSPSFTTGNGYFDDEKFLTTFNFRGQLQIGDNILVKGKWVNDKKYGWQFAISEFTFDEQPGQIGLEKWLSLNKSFEGIGKAKAQIIAANFWENFEDILNNNPKLIQDKAKLSEKQLIILQNAWRENKYINVVATQLASWDLTKRQIDAVIQLFGSSAATILKEDPYKLLYAIPGYGFKKIDAIALKIGISKTFPSRISNGILFVVREREDKGNVVTELKDLLRKCNELLILDCINADEVIFLEMARLVNESEDERPSLYAWQTSGGIMVGGVLSLKEWEIANILYTQSKHTTTLPKTFSLPDVANQHQKEAIQNALSYRISYLGGGAGTGKSFTASRIVDQLALARKSIALCAPTGKAAKRLEELTTMPATTIHRLLEFVPSMERQKKNGSNNEDEETGKPIVGGFKRNKFNHLEVDYVIVDEISMCDSAIFYALITSINFNRTSLLIIGDHNQLSPVGAGNPLRDIINTDAIPSIILTEVVRQSGLLLRNCQEVLKGKVPPSPPKEHPELKSWQIWNKWSEPQQVKMALEVFFSEGNIFDRLELNLINDIQIITPMHKGELGTKELNIFLQKVIQKRLYGVTFEDKIVNGKDGKPFIIPVLRAGDKVMCHKNNYDFGVMNGSIGRVIECNSEQMIFEFDDKEIIIDMKEDKDKSFLEDIQLAYATTVHKMQGSEFKCVIGIIDRSHAIMHHRNLIYTLVTRAQKHCFLMGEQSTINKCALRVETDKRETLLAFMGEDFPDRQLNSLPEPPNMQKALPGIMGMDGNVAPNNDEQFSLFGLPDAGQLERERLQLIEDLKDPEIPF